jgi:hypothetical protein
VNAQVKTMEAIEQGERDIGFWHLQNALDFMCNGHTLVNFDIPGKINVAADKLSWLEVSRDYHLNKRVFHKIQ